MDLADVCSVHADASDRFSTDWSWTVMCAYRVVAAALAFISDAVLSACDFAHWVSQFT